MGVEWVKPVVEFARVVLPDLLTYLGEQRADQAFAELHALYEQYKGDPAAARLAIADLGAEVQQERARRADKRAARRQRRDAAAAADPSDTEEG